MDNFIAIDVETANNHPSRICAIGAVKVVGGLISDSRYSLINPEPDWYSRACTAVHGLSDADTWNAPAFGTVWQQWEPWFGDLPMVAHNAAFDRRCINAACRVYQLEAPEHFLCTLSAARRTIPKGMCASKSLPALCDFFGIPFHEHHNALADAEACAKLAVILL